MGAVVVIVIVIVIIICHRLVGCGAIGGAPAGMKTQTNVPIG
jgi:hypothetical protein